MPANYRINGTLAFEEYLEGHKILAAKRRLWIRGIVTIYGAGILFYGMLFAPSKPDWTFASLGAVLVVYGIIISPVQFRYRVKRNWERHPRIRKEFNIRVSSDGVEITDDKGNPSHSNWDSFVRFRESQSLFILYLSPLLPLCLPKRLIPDAELSGLRRLLSTRVGNKSNGDQNDGNGLP